MSESALQAQILKSCLEKGLMARAVEYRGRRYCPDVVIIGSPCVWLELKNPNKRGKLSEGQAREAAKIVEAGGIVYLIDSMGEFDEIVRRYYT